MCFSYSSQLIDGWLGSAPILPPRLLRRAVPSYPQCCCLGPAASHPSTSAAAAHPIQAKVVCCLSFSSGLIVGLFGVRPRHPRLHGVPDDQQTSPEGSDPLWRSPAEQERATTVGILLSLLQFRTTRPMWASGRLRTMTPAVMDRIGPVE